MKALTVGLTGGIGSGKSLALDTFRKAGAVVVDTDEIARAQARPGGKAYKAIVKAFGTADRKRIAELVFKRPGERRKLENITHPLILKELRGRMTAARNKIFVAAVPLLFEAGLEKTFDVTMTIEAPKSSRLRRVTARDGMTKGQVLARMKAQLPESVRRLRADVVVENGGAKAPFVARIRSYQRALALLRHGAASAR